MADLFFRQLDLLLFGSDVMPEVWPNKVLRLLDVFVFAGRSLE